MKHPKSKTMISFILILLLTVSAGTFASFGAAATPIKLYLNDQSIEASPAVYTSGNVIMVPLKQTAIALGYTVSFDPITSSITLKKDKETAGAILGKNSYSQGDLTDIKLSAATVSKGGPSMVPVDFFKTILNCGVKTTVAEVRIYQNPVLKDANTTIAINAGDSFSVELSENITTGYLWSFSTEANGPSLIGVVNIPPSGTLLGAASVKNWLFTAPKAGTYTLIFDYKRSTGTPANTYKYTIVVSERTSKSVSNVSTGKLSIHKNDKFTLLLGEDAANGYSWNYSGVGKATSTTTVKTSTFAGITGAEIYTLADGTTSTAGIGQTVTDHAINTTKTGESMTLTTRSLITNTKAEGITTEPNLRSMTFRGNTVGFYNLRLDYKGLGSTAPVKTVIYEIEVK